MKTQLLTLTILLIMPGLAHGYVHGELLPEPDPEVVIAALAPMIQSQTPEQGSTRIVVAKLASSLKKLPKDGPIPEGRVLPPATRIAGAPIIFNEAECEMIDAPKPTTPQAARALRKLTAAEANRRADRR